MRERKSKRTYQAVCAVCYTCVLATSTRKRDVEIAATSHINAYKHHVFITEPLPVPQDETERTK